MFKFFKIIPCSSEYVITVKIPPFKYPLRMEVLFLNSSLGMKSAFLTPEKLRTERQGLKISVSQKSRIVIDRHFLT